MVETLLRSRRRRASEQRLAATAARYAAAGWPVCPGAFPPGSPGRPGRSQDLLRACSCDRIGCPDPAAHPVAPTWQMQASADPDLVAAWWLAQPQANIILATGRTFDVLDVPARAGLAAITAMRQAGVTPGPVAIGADRALFFVATRGAPDDEDEWWSCHLDCEPEITGEVAGLRWHCRDSFVLAPPSRLPDGQRSRWLVPPPLDGQRPPDGLRLLEFLADACETA